MERGFKAKAEREAARQRQLLGLRITDPLLARKLIRHHEILLLTPQRIPGMSIEHLCQLLETDISGWSAVTLTIGTQVAIIYNSSHSPGRQETDLTHEVSHILCRHEPMLLMPYPGLPLALRTYNADQEKEADWLAGCLKLPREALLWAVRSDMDNDSITSHFHTNLQLVKYRRDKTGINRQLMYARGR